MPHSVIGTGEPHSTSRHACALSYGAACAPCSPRLEPPRELRRIAVDLLRLLRLAIPRLNDLVSHILTNRVARELGSSRISRIDKPLAQAPAPDHTQYATSITPASPARASSRTVSIRGSNLDANHRQSGSISAQINSEAQTCLTVSPATVIWLVAVPERTSSIYENAESLVLRDAGVLLCTLVLTARPLGLWPVPLGITGEPLFLKHVACATRCTELGVNLSRARPVHERAAVSLHLGHMQHQVSRHAHQELCRSVDIDSPVVDTERVNELASERTHELSSLIICTSKKRPHHYRRYYVQPTMQS